MNGPRARRPAVSVPRGFTMIELLVAMTILVLAVGLICMSFYNISRAWQRGQALTKDLDHGDFVMDQLAMALRSAYFPDTSHRPFGYGLWLDDDGDGENARDSISWVKLGSTLIGQNSAAANAPHRVTVTVEDGNDGEPGITVRAWRPYAQSEDFDPADLPTLMLSKQVMGLNCRVATNVTLGGELEWEDEWKDTNRLPPAVEITLYLKPLETGEPAIEMKRYIGIPIAPQSWR